MKNIPAEYKKFLYLGAVAVIAVWLFCIVFAVTYNKKPQSQASTQPQDAASFESSLIAASQTTQESSQEPSSKIETTKEEETAHVTIDANNVTTAPQYANPINQSVGDSQNQTSNQSQADSSTSSDNQGSFKIPSGTEEIVSTYINAVNKLKSTSNFTLTKTNNFDIKIDSISGGKSVESIVQKLIDSNADNTPKTYTFVNSNDAATGTTPSAEIAPSSTLTSLDASAVKSATATKNGNGCTITIELPDDEQTLNAPASIYSSAMDTISIDKLGLTSAMTVSSLNIKYSSGKITAEIDGEGRIVAMKHYISIPSAVGTGKITLINVNLEMHGSNTQEYNIKY